MSIIGNSRLITLPYSWRVPVSDQLLVSNDDKYHTIPWFLGRVYAFPCSSRKYKILAIFRGDPGFQVRGGILQKIVGVFRVKNHDFMPKNLIFFQFYGGRAPDAPLILVMIYVILDGEQIKLIFKWLNTFGQGYFN